MPPIWFFIFIVCALTGLLIVDAVFRRRRACAVSEIGAAFRMNYSPLDRFALTQRLVTAPEWSLRASDLSVKDVLYATRDGDRCFVATVKCRRTFDQDPLRFVVRLIERDGAEHRLDLVSMPSHGVKTDGDLYRRFLSEWDAGASG